MSGSGYYMIYGQRFDFTAGDIILINSHEVHCAYETSDLRLKIIMIGDGLRGSRKLIEEAVWEPFDHVDLRYPRLIRSDAPHHAEVAHFFAALEAEYNDVQSGRSVMILTYFLQAMVAIQRHFLLDEPVIEEDSMNNVNADIRGVLRLIEHNISDDWTLERLAEESHMSTSYFTATFTRMTGYSPIDYLISRRLDAACYKLIHSNNKIASIAVECGFKTLSNFNRLFRKHQNMTPSQYRKQYGKVR